MADAWKGLTMLKAETEQYSRSTEAGLLVSSNRKTGLSLNLDHGSCRPTKLCRYTCYGRKVLAAEARKLGVRPNAAPITWPTQQAAYKRNRKWLETASGRELQGEARRIAEMVRRRGRSDLRVCGMGDLTGGLVRLCEELVGEGILVWGFSRKPEMIRRMPSGASILGSVDESTPRGRTERLMEATAQLLGRPALAYMTRNPGWVGRDEVDGLWFLPQLEVVFGYHAGSHHTVVEHPLSCPATDGKTVDGEAVVCIECKRCMLAGRGVQ